MRSHKMRLRRRRVSLLLRRRGRQICCFALLIAMLLSGYAAWYRFEPARQWLRHGLSVLEDAAGRIRAAFPVTDSTAEPTPPVAAEEENQVSDSASAGAVYGGGTAVSTAAQAPAAGDAIPSPMLTLLAGVGKAQTHTAPVSLTLAAAELLEFKNCTGYDIDAAALMANAGVITIDDAGPQVLVIHTHGSEAYTPDGEDQYEESDPYRTEDPNYNMVRVGEELCRILESRGIGTVHDTTLHDYPVYNGSYTRSMEAIEAWLEQYPSIKVVLDLHRDAIEYSDGTAYKTYCTVDGEPSAQILILCGTDDSGLYHPNWQENLAFGFTLQAYMDARWPGLTRPLKVSQYRYNMHATAGSLLIEVGSHGNTLQEALTAIRCFAEALADVLLSAQKQQPA